MKILRTILLLFVFLTFPLLSARTQPTGEWLSAKLNFNLPKKFSFKITNSERFLNSGTGLYKFFFEFEGGYKINKHFDAALIYRTAWRLEENEGFYYRDKLTAQFSADQSWGRFKGSNRLRWERRTRVYKNDVWDQIALQHIRDKVSLEYNIRKSKFTPEASVEVFFPLYAFKTRTIDEIRYGINLGYKFSKRHSVKGGVLIQNGIIGIPVNAIWFKMGYTYTIKL